MPSKEFRIWINESIYVVVDLVMIRGQVVSFVVRLMLIESDREDNVVRYDTSHGVPHRDTLGRRKGLIRKDWYPDVALDVVLQRAIEDCRVNYERYLNQFKEN